MNEKDMARIAERIVGAGSEQYKDLNDAADAYRELASLQKGSTEIWYMRADYFRWGIFGYESNKEEGTLPDPKNLKKTHVLLGKIKERDLEDIFRLMQGENWSPQGEARSLITRKGLRHTSMSMGDIIKVGSKVMMADTLGFVDLNE